MPNFTIIIPVFEETDALSFSRFYFDALEVKPIYALDSKRSHRHGEVEALLGRAVSIYENPGSCIEANYGNLASLAPTMLVADLTISSTRAWRRVTGTGSAIHGRLMIRVLSVPLGLRTIR